MYMKYKKLTAAVMAVMMAAGLAGCGTSADKNNAEGTKQNSTQTNGTESKGSEAGTSQQAGGLEVTEDGVTPKGVYPIVPEKITMKVLISQLPHVSDLQTNEFTAWFEEATNIHLDMVIVPDEGYVDKLNLLLSTGDYPEVIMSSAARSNNDIVKYGMDEKIYIPLNPYIDKYSENLVARWEEMPEIKEGMTAPDGNVYALPVFEGYTGHGAVSYKQWVNQDWLDKLGLDIPKTVDEYYEMLRAFKEKDPNGDGVMNEVPLSGATNTWAADPYYFILNAFDYFDESMMKLKDGKFTTTADTDGFRDGLRFMNKLYSEGLLDPASLTQELAQLTQLANNENDLLGSYSAGHMAMGIDIHNKELFDKWTYLLPLTGPSGYCGVPVSDKQAINGGAFAITDKCKNPAAAFRLADAFYEGFDGYVNQNYYKGKTWYEVEPGTKGVTGYPAKASTIFREGAQETTNWAATTCLGNIKEYKLYLKFEGDPKDPANYEGYLIQVTEEYKKFASPYDQVMPAWYDSDTATELANMFIPIKDYIKASIVDFVTGKKNIETDWEGYLKDLDKLGYYDYVDMTQKANYGE